MQKNLLLTLLSVVLITSAAFAQYCGGSATNVCTVGGPYSQLGFYPSYDSIPCVQIGVAYNQKVDMQIPPSTVFQGQNATINWIRIDSIENLPCGLCWRSNNANNQFNGNSAGCIRISGTSFDQPGQYKLRIRITINATVGIFPVTLNNQDADQFGVKYWARVENLNGTCTAVDTLATGLNKHSTGTAPAASITGTTSFCSGGSTTLALANANNYYAYKWSNNATSASITASTAGTYSVTAYANCATATATVSVTVNNAQPSISASGPLTFCQGGSVTLDAGNGFSGYSWSTGATTQSITVSTGGTYTVTVTNSGCTGTDSKTVTVTSNNLTPSIVASPSLNICPGGSTTLDAGQGYTAYLWSDNSTAQTLVANAGGTYTVTVSQGTCSGTASVTVNQGNFPLTVNITPAGPVSACVGETVTLDAGGSYSGYTWSNGDNSQTTDVTATNTYTVTAMDAGCVGTASVQVTFNALPDPVISPFGTQTICSNQTVTLSLDQPYDSYSWTGGATSATTTVSQGGQYNVTVTLNGCSGSSGNPVTVVVNQAPNAAATLLGSAGGFAVLQASPAGGTYSWLSQTTQGGAYTNTGKTTLNDTVPCGSSPVFYSVVVTQNGCVDTSDAVSVSCTGLNDLSATIRFAVMPNPASEMVTISYDLPQAEQVQINLIDLSGRLLQRVFNGHQSKGLQQVQIHLHDFASGTYFINFNTGSDSFSKVLIKE